MGFEVKWIDWINWCISTSCFSVLINDHPAGFFTSSSGLRQGDPLSPFLFVRDMGAFSLLIHKSALAGFLSVYRVRGRGSEEMQITQLLFADDTLVFCKDSRDQMTYLSWILVWVLSVLSKLG